MASVPRPDRAVKVRSTPPSSRVRPPTLANQSARVPQGVRVSATSVVKLLGRPCLVVRKLQRPSWWRAMPPPKVLAHNSGRPCSSRLSSRWLMETGGRPGKR